MAVAHEQREKNVGEQSNKPKGGGRTSRRYSQRLNERGARHGAVIGSREPAGDPIVWDGWPMLGNGPLSVFLENHTKWGSMGPTLLSSELD